MYPWTYFAHLTDILTCTLTHFVFSWIQCRQKLPRQLSPRIQGQFACCSSFAWLLSVYRLPKIFPKLPHNLLLAAMTTWTRGCWSAAIVSLVGLSGLPFPSRPSCCFCLGWDWGFWLCPGHDQHYCRLAASCPSTRTSWSAASRTTCNAVWSRCCSGAMDHLPFEKCKSDAKRPKIINGA